MAYWRCCINTRLSLLQMLLRGLLQGLLLLLRLLL